MSLIDLLVILIVFGILFWIVNNALPIQPNVKNIISIILGVILILVLLGYVGVINLHHSGVHLD